MTRIRFTPSSRQGAPSHTMKICSTQTWIWWTLSLLHLLAYGLVNPLYKRPMHRHALSLLRSLRSKSRLVAPQILSSVADYPHRYTGTFNGL